MSASPRVARALVIAGMLWAGAASSADGASGSTIDASPAGAGTSGVAATAAGAGGSGTVWASTL